MTAANEQELEARRIYRAVFGRPIPRILLERFREPSNRLDQAASGETRAAYGRAIARVGDLESLELAARLTGRLKLLTLKFQLMTFLAETRPDHQSFFWNRRSSLPAGFVGIGVQGVASIVRAVKGLWLLRVVSRA